MVPAPKKKSSSTIPSIGEVLDTGPVSQTLPPPPASRPGITQTPSWIGPKKSDRIVKPGTIVVKHPVTIKFSAPDLEPPVFISTNLTEPEWDPVEMELSCNGEQPSVQYTFLAEEGEYQYKLRLGTGDWWICDESNPTIDDDDGNQNNLVVVKPQVDSPQQPSSTPSSAIDHGPLLAHELHLVKANQDRILSDNVESEHMDTDQEEEDVLSRPLAHEVLDSGTSPATAEADPSHIIIKDQSSGHREATEADRLDPSIPDFPTDHAGMMLEIGKIESASNQQNINETGDDYDKKDNGPPSSWRPFLGPEFVGMKPPSSVFDSSASSSPRQEVIEEGEEDDQDDQDDTMEDPSTNETEDVEENRESDKDDDVAGEDVGKPAITKLDVLKET